jgi:AcrR family transcriptional regulator
VSKTGYHHRDLRQALIGAARQLIGAGQGADFSLSDACRMAGVTTAAPYRHFPDKMAIVDAVVAEAFLDMTARARAAAEQFPAGARDRILAVGRVYLGFAIAEPALFRMMFGQRPGLAEGDIVTKSGRDCFAYVLEEVIDYCGKNGVAGDARLVAIHLWTLVHGAASLTIDGDYAKVTPDVDIERMIESGAERLLFSLPVIRDGHS